MESKDSSQRADGLMKLIHKTMDAGHFHRMNMTKSLNYFERFFQVRDCWCRSYLVR